MVVQAHTLVVIHYRGRNGGYCSQNRAQTKTFSIAAAEEFSVFSKALKEKIFPSKTAKIQSSRIPDFPRHVVSGFISHLSGRGLLAVFSFG
jgi:hypothetical protein